MSCKLELRILESSGALFQAAAALFASLALEAIQAEGRFCVALSGGSTFIGCSRLNSSKPFPGRKFISFSVTNGMYLPTIPKAPIAWHMKRCCRKSR